MITDIKGLHHITSMAGNAQSNNDFFTKTLGLRRVKKTVNFDAPDVYHLYYGDAVGTPGSVMTYFPFPHMPRGRPGTGEVSTTGFAIPEGALGYWKNRLQDHGVTGLTEETAFGADTLKFDGPDGERFSLVEAEEDDRPGWTGNGVSQETAIRGFQSASMRLRDGGAMSELLTFMGYRALETDGPVTRFAIEAGNEANILDVETLPGKEHAAQGAGSVHHIAFAVENREKQLEVRRALLDTGYQVTPVIDRDYFWAIYFRTPGGVLFEIATNEPGFDRDEDTAHLGEALQLPSQHEHLRDRLEDSLPPIVD
ncbi:VOC family protein [Roseobacter weihaiensis]|uniref:VOC family protein n=1 Tax=Roseobacter weihaiensis TaxID=2763262 RepID=UPI001D0A4485|nr:VOC family protein [Roseobacter sp. H9]